MRVLEIGPGDGYFTGAAVDRVGPEGRVVCLDIQVPMLKKLRAALGPAAPPLVCASGSQLPFRTGVFDAAFLVHVLGEIPDRIGALRECARVLRPEGTLAVTEGLPDPDFVRPSRLAALGSSAGLRPAQRYGGSLHYTQRFRAEDARVHARIGTFSVPAARELGSETLGEPGILELAFDLAGWGP
jgi:ubiquinone/menaquinone biosynthesis C-methylase UbiE